MYCQIIQHIVCWLAYAATLGLAGCSAFTSPKEQPVIEDKIGDNYGTLAVTAERRIIIFSREKAESSRIKHICAEPSPDVAESLLSSLKAVAEATAKNGNVEVARASLEVSKSLATAISTVFTRSQGIQFYRDGMYALCQAHLNGVIDSPQLLEELKNLRVAAFDLIKQEIPSIETKRIENAALRAEQARDAAAQSATGAKTSQTEAAESAEAAAASAAGSKR